MLIDVKARQRMVHDELHRAMGEAVAHAHREWSDYLGPDWSPVVVSSFSRCRARSYGGVRRGQPFVTFSLFRFRTMGETGVTFHEYASIAHRSGIGNLENVGWRTYLRVLVAHEVAHAIQYSLHPSLAVRGVRKGMLASTYDRTYRKPHGAGWRSIYRNLRAELLATETASLPLAASR